DRGLSNVRDGEVAGRLADRGRVVAERGHLDDVRHRAAGLRRRREVSERKCKNEKLLLHETLPTVVTKDRLPTSCHGRVLHTTLIIRIIRVKQINTYGKPALCLLLV